MIRGVAAAAGSLTAVLVGLSLALFPGAAAGEGWRVVFDIENDVLVDEDRHYTNGLFLSVLAPKGNVPSWIARAAYVLPPYDDDPSEVRWGLGLAHEMYTPTNSSAERVVLDDRPYAGFLYLRFELYRDRYRDVAEKIPYLDSFEIDMGVVGPAAIAEQGQDLIHALFPAPTFKGWDNQLENEFGLVLRRARHWRLPGEPIEIGRGLQLDAIANLTAELGNVKTAGSAGVLLRGGWRLPADFGRGRFSPTQDPGQGYRLFIFAGAELSGVVRDIFLDGNTFRDSHDVDKRAAVVHAPLGIAFERGRFRSLLEVIWNSEEFEGQDGADLYGRWSVVVDY
jgi:lipid A 3-O-deacylase